MTCVKTELTLLLYRGVTDQTQKSWMRAASFGLAVLSFINLFNYLDRYVVSALVESLKHSELGLSDANLGSLMSGFLIVYTLVAPVFGALGDRDSRPRLIAFGVACWSVATALSGFAGQLPRAVRGARLGRRRRGRLRHHRAEPAVGLFSRAPARPGHGDLFLRHPGRLRVGLRRRRPGRHALRLAHGILRRRRSRAGAGGAVPGAARSAARQLRTADASAPDSRAGAEPHRSSVGQRHAGRLIGGCCTTSPTCSPCWDTPRTPLRWAAWPYWMPAFLERARGIPRSEATVSFGTIVVITGFIGTFAGGWLGRLLRQVLAAGISVDVGRRHAHRGALRVDRADDGIAALYLACMVTAQLCLFLSTGPINAAIVNLVIASERATAIALEVFTIHLLGDALSPPLIGALSDHFSLAQAVKIVPIAVVIGGCVWAWAALAQPKGLAHEQRALQ